MRVVEKILITEIVSKKWFSLPINVVIRTRFFNDFSSAKLWVIFGQWIKFFGGSELGLIWNFIQGKAWQILVKHFEITRLNLKLKYIFSPLGAKMNSSVNEELRFQGNYYGEDPLHYSGKPLHK
jgi:hypothetical protein